MKICLHINKNPMTTKFRQFHIILVQKVAINRQNFFFQLIQAKSEKFPLCSVSTHVTTSSLKFPDQNKRLLSSNQVKNIPGGPKKTFQLWGCIANKLHYRETSNLDGLML